MVILASLKSMVDAYIVGIVMMLAANQAKKEWRKSDYR